MKLASHRLDGYLQQPKQTRVPMLHLMGMETESSAMSMEQAWFSLRFISATRLTNTLGASDIPACHYHHSNHNG